MPEQSIADRWRFKSAAGLFVAAVQGYGDLSRTRLARENNTGCRSREALSLRHAANPLY